MLKQILILLLTGLLCGQVLGQNYLKSSPSKTTLTNQAPLMGWASWNNYRVNINEGIIRKQADAMVRLGLDTIGYQYINIDDGFFGGRDKDGSLLAHHERFPSGMLELSNYIHCKGLKAGIYTDAGINTCASYWDKDTIGVGMGLYGHDQRDLVKLLVEWNYDFIKVDWCGGDWLGLDEQIRYTQIANIIKQIKPEVKYNVCRWQFPGKWVTTIADSWRISGDIANDFESVLKIIDINSELWKYCSHGHYNDMDMLQVGRGMSYEEDKAHFSMWCMMNSPLVLGNDLTQISKETLQIISNQDLIAINQNPFAYQARKIVDNGETEIFARPLYSTMSGKVAVALLNRSDKKQTISLDLKQIGININDSYRITDLWSKETIDGLKKVKLDYNVSEHGAIVLLIEGESIPYNIFEYK
ncbi:MAG: glycoside hydrolase family 27 protein [Bacteroidota bacterium]